MERPGAASSAKIFARNPGQLPPRIARSTVGSTRCYGRFIQEHGEAVPLSRAAEEQLAAAGHAGGGGSGFGLGRGRAGAIFEIGDRIAVAAEEERAQRRARLWRQHPDRVCAIFSVTPKLVERAGPEATRISKNAGTDRRDDFVTTMSAWKAPPVTPTRDHFCPVFVFGIRRTLTLRIMARDTQTLTLH